MVALIDKFNQVSLHDAPSEILSLYSHVEEITDIDERGELITRPLFSHSDIPFILRIPEFEVDKFKWDEPAIYSVFLHHNNPACVRNLDIIPSKILQYIRLGKCKLILDNSKEGDTLKPLLKDLYSSLEKLKIEPKQVYYITNNLYAEEYHKNWLAQNNIQTPVNIIEHAHNIQDVQHLMQIGHLPKQVDIRAIFEQRKTNKGNFKTFLKVNRTARPERDIFMLFVNKLDLYSKFKISYNRYGDFYNEIPPDVKERFKAYYEEENVNQLLSKIPFDIDKTDETNHGPAGFGLNQFNADLPYNPDHYLDTFISTVMCAFPFVTNACHLHSSTFNPMYCGHPILQFGPYKHLERLKQLGFKTFDKWWDESYDNMEIGWDRFEAVLKQVEQLSKLSVEELLDMNYEMLDVLQHNSDLIKNFKSEDKLSKRIFNEPNLL